MSNIFLQLRRFFSLLPGRENGKLIIENYKSRTQSVRRTVLSFSIINYQLSIITIIALIAAAIILPSSSFLAALLSPTARETTLEACERNKTLFADPAGERSTATAWSETYHARVGEVLDAHMDAAARIECAGDPHVEASDTLKQLASVMEPWKGSGVPPTENDMAPVLLAYLDAYECALQERSETVFDSIRQETLSTIGRILGQQMTVPDILERAAAEQAVIDDELRLARPALHRTLLTLSGTERLRPLEVALQCIERSSLDIRNALGLAAEASACMPRVWDARGTLRNLAE